MKRPAYMAGFDSASAMVRATARFLGGADFPMLGMIPPQYGAAARAVGAAVNQVPPHPRQFAYRVSGWLEAVPPDVLGRPFAETLSEWAAAEYPARRYPAVMIGASNGAAVHLCAALGIPWLPQTFLIPVRRHGVPVDDMDGDIAAMREPARRMLEANPDLQLHHMHDPSQDRLMIRYMTYFRAKRLRLGAAYERFLATRLERGGTVVVVDCRQRWPTTQLGERHIFQAGGMGGAAPEEYLQGSARVSRFLSAHGSPRHSWQPPRPDADRPEAEWGFEPALAADIAAVARAQGLRVVRLAFDAPEMLAPAVADLYRAWYRRRRLPANRLLVESFILLEPWWTMRTGSVPFWMKFNTERSAQALESYLDGADPYDEILLMLFSHGARSIGLADTDRWRRLLGRARSRSATIGVDPDRYPADFATFVRYQPALRALIRSRYPLPPPLRLAEAAQELHRLDPPGVRWVE